MMKKGAKVWSFIAILVFLFAIPSLCFVVMVGGVGVDGCLFGDQNIGKVEDLHSNSYQPRGANSKIITLLSTFDKGNIVEVYDTGTSGLHVREEPCGVGIGRKFDGDVGMILDGPVYCDAYNWYHTRWSDEDLEGWSAEGFLRKKAFVPSTNKFNIGNHVEVCNTGAIGLYVRTDPPELAKKEDGGVFDGYQGVILDGPFYGVPKGTTGLFHFWKVEYDSVKGWCAEGYPGVVDYLKLVINQPPNTPTMLFQLKSDGVTPIPVGSETTENSVTFKGVVSDLDGDQVKLQVELRRLDEYGGQFDETQGGFKESGFLESGSEAVAYANDLIDADYHWRARAVDEHGNEGEWVNFGNNFNSEIDFRVSWRDIKKYAPILKFDSNERYLPCDIHGDDDNVINNHENYDTSDLPKTTDDGKQVCYYYVKEYTEQSGIYPEHPDYYVYEYWYYYAFNEYDICVINDLFCIIEDCHEHDLESVFIWVDKKTGNPFHLALSCHQWFNEYEIHSVDELAIYVEKGGHGMSKDGKNNVLLEYNKAFYAGLILIYLGDPDEGIEVSFKSDGSGEVLKGNDNFDFRPLDSLIQYGDRDLVKDEGSIYYNQFKSGCTKPGEYDSGGNKYDDDCPFEYGEDKTPWYRCDNPEEEVSMIRGQTILSIISGIIPLKILHALQLPLNSPELGIYDSQGNVTGLVGGEVKEEIPNSIYDEESKTIIIFSPTDLNSYRYEIVGTDKETYVFRVTSVEGGEFTNFTATDIPTTPGAIHQYTIDWAALSQGEKGVTVKIDSDGVFERTIITNNSFHPLIAEFTVSPENPIIGEKVTLDASTSFDLGGGEIKKYRWEFYNAANQDPFYVIDGHDKKIIRYSFTSEGIYLVRLTVTDDEGEYGYTESITKVCSAKSDEDIRLDVPFFSQSDSKWKDQKLGKSKLTIGGSGCALTSVAMVSKYFGWDIDPLRLDAALTEIDGISTGGNLDWTKVEEASGGYVVWIEKKRYADWSNIDQELSQDNPCPCIINGYWNDGKNPHKVVIRGKVGSKYPFWDPSDPPPGKDRIWPNGAETYTWGNEESGNEELYDPRIYLYHKGPRPSEKNPISVNDTPPYFYKWSNKGDLKSWKKKECEGHTYNSTYVGGMYYDRNNPKNDPNKPDCWMEFTPYLQSAGKYDIYVGICADSTRSTEVKYTIYPNGIDGSSETVSKSQYSDEECWKEIKLGVFDLTGEGKTHVRITEATGEAFDGKKTLCVGTIRFTKATDTLNILTPTQTAYRNVGAHDKPTKTSIEVEIKTSTDAFVLGLTNRDDYTVKIGDKTADVLIVIQKSDRYVLEIMPPKQAGDGKYDLHVELGPLSDVESNAINYGTKGLDVALIIDSSGSMSDNDPEGYRKAAAKYFVDLANTGDKICVADFGHNDCDSRLLLPLLEIIDESSKDTVKTAIDQVVSSGATPIGGGLEKGYDELSSPRAVAGHNKVGILLTDGNDTCGTEGAARTYAQKFGDNGWVLYTIGLTGDADEYLLQKLAALGNGEYYKAPTNEQLLATRSSSITAFFSGEYYKAPTNVQLQEIYRAISGRVAGKQTMDDARGTAQEGSTSVENALIDSSVTEVKFTISWAGSDLNLTLKKPDGGIIDPDVAEADPNVIYTSASSYEFYTVQSPMPGEWELRIFGADVPAGGEEYTACVMGTANLTMNMYFDREHYSVGEPIKVSVSLTDALQPITEASVIADIELSPTASSSLKNLAGKDTLQNSLSIAQDQITLFDDGMHGDGMANDGVYANFYTNTNIEGTYKFTAKATGTRSPEEFERVIEQSLYVSVTPTPRPTLAPRPTLTPTPRPTLRPTATLFEKIEGLTAAIRVGVGI